MVSILNKATRVTIAWACLDGASSRVVGLKVAKPAFPNPREPKVASLVVKPEQ